MSRKFCLDGRIKHGQSTLVQAAFHACVTDNSGKLTTEKSHFSSVLQFFESCALYVVQFFIQVVYIAVFLQQTDRTFLPYARYSGYIVGGVAA